MFLDKSVFCIKSILLTKSQSQCEVRLVIILHNTKFPTS